MSGTIKHKEQYADKNVKPCSQGFTLIEIVIVILVGSFILLALFRAYSGYLEQKAIDDTKESIERIEAGMAAFFRINNRYPCPADPSAEPGDPEYGREAGFDEANPIDRCGGANFDPSASLDWIREDVESLRDVDGDGTIGDADDLILIGAIPFRDIEPCIDNPGLICNTLPLYETYSLDEWNNKFLYAVTEHLTNSTDFRNESGGISIIDEFGESVIEPEDSAHYVIVSQGPNQYGAHSQNGAFINRDCSPNVFVDGDTGTEPNPPPVVSDNETENCDRNDSVFLSGLRNDTDADYFDDIITYKISAISSLWKSLGINQITNNNQGNVGIGDFEGDDNDPMTTNDDIPRADLHIKGDMQSLETYTDQLCDESGSICFVPEFLGGASIDTVPATPGDPFDYQNTCSDPSQAIQVIANNQVTCVPVFSGVIPGVCPPGEVMTGYSNTSGIICGPL